ncbi:hypothetical protein [Cellulomonas denverensis]|uniref:hypothetical protein n=1 Tax=Cellulomonas denverensis TaxID=264297 RepID=UPI0035EB06C8
MAPDRSADDAPRDDEGRSDASVTDEQWAAIVADLRDTAASGTTTGDDDAAPGPAVTYPVAPWVSDRRVVRPDRDEGPGADPGGADPRGWDATSQIERAEQEVDRAEHFVPPPAPPVFGGDPLLTVAWLAVAGMPLFWLVVVIAWKDAPATVMQASGIVFLAGLAVLFWRMPHRRGGPDGEGDDDDDGAVV